MDRIFSTSQLKQLMNKRLVTSCVLMATAFGNHTSVAAEANNTCVNEFLKVHGSPPKTIMPGKTALISLVSSNGKKEAEIKLSARNINKLLVVSGEIRNVGACNISMFQPIKLHPISNGLPLGWHSLPEGIAQGSRLEAGRWQTFSKEYSKDYLGGLNLSIGSWSLEVSPKQEEAKKEEPTPEQAETKPSTPLSDAEKLFAEALENDDLTEANQRLNDAFARAQRESAANESLQNTMRNSIQMMQTLQAQQILLEQQKVLNQQRRSSDNGQSRAANNCRKIPGTNHCYIEDGLSGYEAANTDMKPIK